jgi:hypothetical protein
MSNKICRQLIEAQLSAWAKARAPALPVAWENVPFQPTEGATYLRAFLLPAATTGPDLAGALRVYRGVYQVSAVTPINAGPGVAEGIAEEIAGLFPLNLRLTGSGLALQIVTPVTAAKGEPDANEYIVPVSFQYRADTLT